MNYLEALLRGNSFNATKGIDVQPIAPNPIVSGQFTLNISTAKKAQVEMLITDMQGRL